VLEDVSQDHAHKTVIYLSIYLSMQLFIHLFDYFLCPLFGTQKLVRVHQNGIEIEAFYSEMKSILFQKIGRELPLASH
jgi:hypothetical protein